MNTDVIEFTKGLVRQQAVIDGEVTEQSIDACINSARANFRLTSDAANELADEMYDFFQEDLYAA